jgi:hypothetical protein
MKFADDHPWFARFVSVELALIVVTVVLYSLTAPTPSTNPLDWNPVRISGLLIGAFSIVIGVFGLVVGALYAASRFS